MDKRKKTRKIYVGGVGVGGDAPVSVQSMTNTDTRDARATCRQIDALAEAGCEIIRVAVPDRAAAEAIAAIRQNIKIPLVADVHFDYRLAIAAMENGADKLRINPGNIGGLARVQAVVSVAKARGVPIRIGVNAGSLEKSIEEKYGGVTAAGLAESAMRHVRLLESLDFGQICVSIKSSDIATMVDAYAAIAEQTDYPLHVGVTEAGTVWGGSIKSAAGLGALLSRGIGDTVRVSLTGDPVEEVTCAREILKAMRLRQFGVELTSCPTCGRTQIDLIRIANEVERRCAGLDKNIRVAVMGCAVNGPGEAKEADVGIAGGDGKGVLFKKGSIVRTVEEAGLVDALMEEIYTM